MAGMSVGKSTLLNKVLGKDIFHAAKGSVTAVNSGITWNGKHVGDEVEATFFYMKVATLEERLAYIRAGMEEDEMMRAMDTKFQLNMEIVGLIFGSPDLAIGTEEEQAAFLANLEDTPLSGFVGQDPVTEVYPSADAFKQALQNIVEQRSVVLEFVHIRTAGLGLLGEHIMLIDTCGLGDGDTVKASRAVEILDDVDELWMADMDNFRFDTYVMRNVVIPKWSLKAGKRFSVILTNVNPAEHNVDEVGRAIRSRQFMQKFDACLHNQWDLVCFMGDDTVNVEAFASALAGLQRQVEERRSMLAASHTPREKEVLQHAAWKSHVSEALVENIRQALQSQETMTRNGAASTIYQYLLQEQGWGRVKAMSGKALMGHRQGEFHTRSRSFVRQGEKTAFINLNAGIAFAWQQCVLASVHGLEKIKQMAGPAFPGIQQLSELYSDRSHHIKEHLGKSVYGARSAKGKERSSLPTPDEVKAVLDVHCAELRALQTQLRQICTPGPLTGPASATRSAANSAPSTGAAATSTTTTATSAAATGPAPATAPASPAAVAGHPLPDHKLLQNLQTPTSKQTRGDASAGGAGGGGGGGGVASASVKAMARHTVSSGLNAPQTDAPSKRPKW
ncbi:hypothetical protein B484DRAFT_74000 [Ochromonadaceae sp. CCMP2298]|nr:hypothetical protein B484DRAFT_74000 [Ochromonadaceae sp. CCMP2298]